MGTERRSILWRWIGRAGHESARVRDGGGVWELDGSAVFIEDDRPVRLVYQVICDAAWNTRSAAVTGWVGAADIDVRIARDGDGRWTLNGAPQPHIAGCIDVDLNFSPSTNLLPIRRLNLAVGEEALVRAAWLRFPTFVMEVLEQRYRRTAGDTYRYESRGGAFSADIRVDDFGLPLEYEGAWEAV